MNSKFVFWGSPEFAKTVLAEIRNAGLDPVAVVTNPDRPIGRKKVITSPLVKQYISAQNLNYKLFQPEKSKEIIPELRALEPDFFVVAAYGQIISDDVLAILQLGAIGVHPSLLPLHRGASPIQSTILEGDTETGTTLFLMDEKVDPGPILVQERISLASGVTTQSLSDTLARLGGKLLSKVIPEFVAGKLKYEAQDEAQATYTHKFGLEDGLMPPEVVLEARTSNSALAINLERRVRA